MEEAVIQPQPTRAGHIKKRALKNKSLSVSFDEKDLRDYLTGFHKRKKKRRKEGHKQQEEAARRKRIEQRKKADASMPRGTKLIFLPKRKLEKELVLYGGAPPSIDRASDEGDGHHDDDEDGGPLTSVNATTMYDNGEMQVTVTTSEISREDNDGVISDNTPASLPGFTGSRTNQDLSASKKKSFKKVSRHPSHTKPRKKKDKNKGKKKNKKR